MVRGLLSTVRRRSLIGLLGAVLLLLSAGSVWAAPNLTGEPSRLTAEHIDTHEGGQIVEAHGSVVFSQGKEKITAEHLRHNKNSKTVEAWGNVVWHYQGDTLRADRLTVNLTTKLGRAYNARVFVSANHFYMSGREIDKTGEATYQIKDCTITTCDGKDPAWSVKASKVEVTIEGYGHLWHPRFYMGSVPAFYFPYALFPIKNKRESGFLAPTLISSSRDGFAFELPFYWAWADWGETTFYLHHSNDRGQGVGAELNFMLGSTRDRGLFYLDYLYDRKAEELFASGENSTDTKQRYWFRGMLRAMDLLPYNINLNLTVDYPSDPDFIREFDYWETGVARTNNRFNQYFGQSLSDSTATERLNRVRFQKYWTGSNLSAEARYRYDPRPGVTEELIHELPHLRYSFSDRPILNDFFYYNFYVDGRYAHREEGERGHQLDSTVNLYTLLDVGPFLHLQPAVGFRGTYWRVDPNGTATGDFDKDRFRGYWFGSLDLTTSFFKVYEVNGLEWKKVKHAVTPQITFKYIPEHSDPAPTSYASAVGAQETIEYKLITTLTAKKKRGLDDILELKEEMWRRRYLGALADWGVDEDKFAGTTPEELEEEYQRRLRLHRLNKNPSYAYDEFFRLEISQSFDIREARLTKPAGVQKRPFSAIRADLEFKPSRYFRKRLQVEYHPYYDQFLRLALYVDIYDKRGDYLGLQYRRRWDESLQALDIDQLRADARVKLWGPWSAGGQIIYDLDQSKPISETVSLSYQHQCWGIAASYHHSTDDSRVAIVFSLFGLGDIYRYERSVGQKID